MPTETATKAADDNNATEDTEAPKPLPATTMDPFIQSTRHCTRRAWNIFLGMNNKLDVFNTKQVRARIQTTGSNAAQRFANTLKSDGEVTRLSIIDDRIECTATYAAIQLIIKDADFKLMDAIAID